MITFWSALGWIGLGIGISIVITILCLLFLLWRVWGRS